MKISRSRLIAAFVYGLAALTAAELLCQTGILGKRGKGFIERSYEVIGYINGPTQWIPQYSDTTMLIIAMWLSIVSASICGAIFFKSSTSQFSISKTTLLGILIPLISTVMPVLCMSMPLILYGNFGNFGYILLLLPIGLVLTLPVTAPCGIACAFITRSIIQSSFFTEGANNLERRLVLLKSVILHGIGWLILFPLCFGACSLLFIVGLMRFCSDPSVAVAGDRPTQEMFEVPQDQMLSECFYTPGESIPSLCTNDGETIFEPGKDPQWVLDVLRFKNFAFDSRYNVMPLNYRETSKQLRPGLGLPPLEDEKNFFVYIKRLLSCVGSKY